jgi:hypothetical protein
MIESPVTDYYLSDHTFVVCNLLVTKPKLTERTFTYRKFKSIDIVAFKNDIMASPLNKIKHGPQTPDEVNTMVKLYNEVLTTLINKHAPLKTKTVKTRNVIPWTTAEVTELKQIRRRAERKWIRNKDITSTTRLKATFKESRNNCKNAMDEAKTKYYSEKVKECAGDQRQLFKLINHLTKPTQDTQYPAHTSLSQLANDFGNFFATKISN